jgi:uncharacterized protein YyaL (SSP411 family)
MLPPAVFCRRSAIATALCFTFLTAAAFASAHEESSRPANRLAAETSPYLRLHAHNPVDWYPWGPEALERAKAENKPIFLSIGYSSCFWCHVMERKVFENETIAAYMNEHFVCIKVDREERPDLDDLYMLALQIYLQATGSGQGGGWPLSIFLTPDGKPIAGGTYFPPEDQPGRPGFPTVLKQVSGLWESQEPRIRETAEVLAKEVRRLAGPQQESATEIPAALSKQAVDSLTKSYDAEFGGFDFRPDSPDGPKFPQPCKLLFLEQQVASGAGQELATQLDTTLTRMANGGLYDQLGGGFHRYSTDRQWRVPHFEKMLYDNAQLAEVYASAAKRTGRNDFRRIAEETIAFVLRDLTDPQGAFYCALDAETDGIEGAYYVWSPEEVQKALGPEDAPLFMAAYGLDQPPTFEHGYVLIRSKSDQQLASESGITADEVSSRLAVMRETLLKIRSRRPALLRDDKALTAWNGLMIRSLVHCGALLEKPEYVAAAEKAAIFLLSNVRTAEGDLLRVWCDGKANHSACLDDYAFLVDGLLALNEASGDEKWLNAGRRLMDDQIERFWDEAGGGFFFTPSDHEPLLARLKDGYDSVMPSGNSTSTRVLMTLSAATGDQRYQDRARRTVLAFAGPLEQSPAGYVAMIQTADQLAAAQPAAVAVESVQLAAGPVKKPAPRSGRPPALQAFAQPTTAEAARHEQVSGKLYLSVDRLAPGSTCRVAMVAKVKEGWHLNANPAKPDYVVPVELELKSVAGVELTDVVYPAGRDITLDGFDEAVSVYEGDVVLYGTLKVPENVSASKDELEFTMRYQACNDKECLRQMKLKLSGTATFARSPRDAKPVNESLFEAETKKQDQPG